MCVWFQSAVHVYRSDLTLAENIFSRETVWRWTNPEAADRWRSSCDDVCLDGYICAATGVLTNAGVFAEVVPGLLVLLIAPILFGASVGKNRRFAMAVFAAWSLIIFWGMYASFSRFGQYASAPEIQAMLLQAPVQYTFDILVLLLLPALPFFVTAGVFTFCLRWFRYRRVSI